MRNFPIACLAGAAALLAPAAASAATTYDFAGSFNADTDNDGTDETYNWLFSFTVPAFLTSLTQVTPSSCSISGSFYTCAATQTVDPYGETFPSTGGVPFLGFNVDNIDGSGGRSSFYFFAANAFSQAGTYTAENPPSGSGFGNAGPAILTLRDQAGAVPEPATWAMMIAGFGMIGASVRQRRRHAVLA